MSTIQPGQPLAHIHTQRLGLQVCPVPAISSFGGTNRDRQSKIKVTARRKSMLKLGSFPEARYQHPIYGRIALKWRQILTLWWYAP
jgi:hypothetical protein